MLSAHQAELAFVLFIHYSEHSATRAAYAFMLYSWLNHPSLYLGGSVNEAQGTGRHSVARWIFVLFVEHSAVERLLGPRGLYFISSRGVRRQNYILISEREERGRLLCLKDYLQFAPQIIGEKKSAHMQNWILKWFISQHFQKLLDFATQHILYLKLGWPNQFRVRAWWGWEL